MLDNTQSIICAFGLASAAPRSPYRHLELCGIAQNLRQAPGLVRFTPPYPTNLPFTPNFKLILISNS
ncbi:MAG TPA: hypothetical protein DD439_10045 [Ruminococcaceae bacterium]|nr:hypothetical protein [Oscillospiraceae bacterium]